MSFAAHTLRCPFVIGFPHFMLALLLSLWRLGFFLTWLGELKDLKSPLVEDGSKVWFGQKKGIPRTFDSFDCAIINCSINLCRYVQLMYNYLKK